MNRESTSLANRAGPFVLCILGLILCVAGGSSYEGGSVHARQEAEPRSIRALIGAVLGAQGDGALSVRKIVETAAGGSKIHFKVGSTLESYLDFLERLHAEESQIRVRELKLFGKTKKTGAWKGFVHLTRGGTNGDGYLPPQQFLTALTECVSTIDPALSLEWRDFKLPMKGARKIKLSVASNDEVIALESALTKLQGFRVRISSEVSKDGPVLVELECTPKE